ncbi:hypothetical protein B0J12DRAFT_690948 [Macrophomina phaseolina]|uniref:Uncharacterized protein n=1 Tax=Macrophomina phaseolina TaxID=35725 RepID=A0ABQ8FQT3_9PEZI|nr:hypothetical protein B0J12DRAFT_690948 [Macrophomina phaseolina]
MEDQQNLDSTCLGVAIDHRLRKLFKPVGQRTNIEMRTRERSHVQHIYEMGLDHGLQHRPVSSKELEVTSQLSMPEARGGIAIALLQPAQSHPYDSGIEQVISGCPTLCALAEVFYTVSRHTVIQLDEVTVIDSMPYTEPEDRLSGLERQNKRNDFYRAIKKKRPDVLLCMWKKRRDMPSLADGTQSLGVGRSFKDPKLPLSSTFLTYRLNAFHPSYAVNYNPQFACFRQLLILEIARACGIQRGEWREAEWMGELRRRCRIKAQSLSNRSNLGMNMLASDFENALQMIERFVRESMQTAFQDNQAALYETFIDNIISERCSDASLCLAYVHNTIASVHPDDITEEDDQGMETILKATIKTQRRLGQLFKNGCPHYLVPFNNFAKDIRNSLTFSNNPKHKITVEWTPGTLCSLLLRLSEDIEAQLSVWHLSDLDVDQLAQRLSAI